MKVGFIALAGRPSVGKSTLLNSLVDANIAITSDKPETTRKAIRGILTQTSEQDSKRFANLDDFQMVFVDTPGIHKSRTLLGERLNTITTEQLTNVDIILFLTPCNEKIGPGDRFIIEQLKQIHSKHIKLFALITKIDLVKPHLLIEKIVELQEIYSFDEYIPISGKNDENVPKLVELLYKYLDDGDILYPTDELTDESWQSMVTEIIREVALESLNDELPHSLIVQLDEKVGKTLFVNLFVERDSQKGIILGKNGENIKRIRQKSTKRVREIINNETILKLHVKVAKEWQKDPRKLRNFGF